MIGMNDSAACAGIDSDEAAAVMHIRLDLAAASQNDRTVTDAISVRPRSEGS